jgi:hypothetical protein
MLHLLTRLLSHLRRNAIACTALACTIAAGGGYAIAATSNTTIHGCVSKRTHALYVQKRCNGHQIALIWSRDGQPQPVAAWAAVQGNGFTGAGARGISVAHVSNGTYSVTATPAQCKNVTDAPTVTVNAAIAPGSTPPGQFPVAWVAHSGSGRNTFTVFTGLVAGGAFVPADEAFNVQVPCS